MKITALKNAEEEVIIRRIIDGLGLPETVKEYRVSLRPDHAGDPSALLLFLMDDKLDEKAFTGAVSKITAQVMDAVLGSDDTERYPFPRFRYFAENETLNRECPGRNW